MGKIDKDLRGGIAGATAMANLPQVTMPGASMVAAGVGHYKGQSGWALGASRMSDGGNWIVKAKVSGNTQGDINVGAGIGYQWR
ncbi:MAG: YadA-like family protein [Neisseria sp.]|nr:YadA-like family protein [Neisseria sp.]